LPVLSGGGPSTQPLFLSVLLSGLRRLKGEYDQTADLEEMRREKEEGEKEAKVSILSLVGR